MDVNVIFQNTVSLDDKRNFLVNFKDEEKIINVLLNRKEDYFITNAIIYINEIKDNSDIDKIKNLEKEAEKYMAMVKSKKFKTIVSKNFSFSYNKDFYIKSFKP